MNLEEMIRAIQTKLGTEADGKAGPQTWKAIYETIVGPITDAKPLPEGDQQVSARSEKVIGTLLPEVQPYARSLFLKAAAAGITIEILSGNRTYAAQDELFEKGRRGVAGEKIVTNARGGHSNHNFGIAFDIGVFEGGAYIGESPKYKAVAVLGKELGLSWGGDWKSIQDEPHFELRPGWASAQSESDMLAALRQRHDAGTGVFA